MNSSKVTVENEMVLDLDELLYPEDILFETNSAYSLDEYQTEKVSITQKTIFKIELLHYYK